MRSIGTAIVALAMTMAAFAAAADKQTLRSPSLLSEQAPGTFRARFDTSKGPFVIEVRREWSPHGADRFYNLARTGFYDDCRFFRVIAGFLVEFGINGDPEIQKAWAGATFADDPVRQSNRRGFVSFANASTPHSRSTRLFINLGDNLSMDENFSPFGQVVAGMDVVDALYSGYAGGPQKQLPRIYSEGNAFLEKTFAKLDFIRTTTIVR